VGPRPLSLSQKVKLVLMDTRHAKPRASDAWRRRLWHDADLGFALAEELDTLIATRVRLAVLRQYGAASPAQLGTRTAGMLAWLGVALVGVSGPSSTTGPGGAPCPT
jgi:hypothetical protein